MNTTKQGDILGSFFTSPRGPIVLGILITLLLTFPGFLSWDSIIQLGQARRGTFSNLHPPTMAFLWRQVELVITGPFGMLLIQVVAIWTGLYFVQKYYLDCRSRIGAIMPMLVVFFPPVFGILGLIVKDVQMAAWLMLATGLAARVVQHKVTDGKIPLRSFIFFCTALWLALAQRHNAIAAAPALVWFLFFSLFFPGKNLFYRLLLTFGMALPATVVLYVLAISANNLLTSEEHRPWAQIAAFDIVGTAAFAEDPDYVEHMQLSSLKGILRTHPVTTEELVASYRPDQWTFIFHDGPFVDFWDHWPNESEAKALADIWLRVVRTYPSAYLSHRFAVFRHALGLGERKPWGVGFTDWHNFADKERAKALHIEATLSPLQELVSLSLRGVQKFTPLFRPYIYGLVSILCLIAGARLLRRERSSLPFFLALSGLGSEATVFLAAPTFDYRYSYWMIFSSVLSLILLVVHIATQRSARTSASDVTSAD